ncbi:sugar phosphate isomerase/epimerase family protein [Castellaniella sp.]|uniref:sugar phosphate isomerase/epimerase family protein n=1 Tax=Castellaniella sp. TaxID=1955812 RepID=UPI003562D21D
MNRTHFGIDLACMAGPLEQRLAAAEQAGFSHVTLWARDLANHPRGYEAAVQVVRESRLQVTGLQLMRNYEGLSGPAHEYKLDIVKALLDVCVDVGAPLLLVCASAAAEQHENALERAETDLRKLANLAVPTGVRVGFKAIPWGRAISDTQAAWTLVDRVNHANLGLVLDAFHFIASGLALDTLNDIAVHKIALVQLADFTVPFFQERALQNADHMRVFPGSGVRQAQVAAFVRHVHWMGYAGNYSLLVFNDDYRQLPAHAVATMGAQAMAWVNTQVLRGRLPLRRHPPS